MLKPSIIFFPGSFNLMSVYWPILDTVSKEGYEIHGIHPPSIGPISQQGRDVQAPTTYDDAAVIARKAERLSDQGKEVIIITHSYGGIPVSQIPKRLAKQKRKAQECREELLELAYMTSIVPAVGKSARDVLGSILEENRVPMAIDENDWLLQGDPVASVRLILQAIPPEQGEARVKHFAKHSGTSFANKLTYAGYKDIPVSYLFCEKDLCNPSEIQRAEIDVIEHVSGRKVDVTYIKTGHCPNDG